MSPKRKMFLAVAIIIVAVLGTGVIILRGGSGNYWMTPGELGKQAEASVGPVRVGGKIVRNSLKSENGKLFFTIKARGESAKLPVEYTGYAPEAFSDLSEVIVEGEAGAGVFYANTILVRCPENYMAEKAAIGLYKTLGIEGALYR